MHFLLFFIRFPKAENEKTAQIHDFTGFQAIFSTAGSGT